MAKNPYDIITDESMFFKIRKITITLLPSMADATAAKLPQKFVFDELVLNKKLG